MCLLLGRSWGLWVIAHLITCSPWTYHRATDHCSNFQLPSILKSIQLYCLPSFYWHQTRTWLLRLIMEFPLIHISDIIPPLYPIVIYLFILVGYPTYRDKNLSLWSPCCTRGTSLSFPWSSVLTGKYWPSLHGTSSTGKRETHLELLTVLRVTTTCWPLLPYAPKLGMVLKISGLTFP